MKIFSYCEGTGKGKFSSVHVLKAYRESRNIDRLFLKLCTDGGKCSPSHLGRFTQGNKSSIKLIGDSTCPRAYLEFSKKQQFLSSSGIEITDRETSSVVAILTLLPWLNSLKFRHEMFTHTYPPEMKLYFF